MRKAVILIVLVLLLSIPVTAMDYSAPPAPEDVEDMMPADTESFGEGLWSILKAAVTKLAPELAAAAGSCLALLAVVIVASLLNAMPGSSKKVICFVSTLALSAILLGQANTMVNLCARTVGEISDYSKLLLPVMTAALASQGGATGAAALYAGTAAFDAVLSTLIAKVLVPLVYVFLALGVAVSVSSEELLKKLRDFVKWLMSWGLKTVLYIFTGYLAITGVITGTVDATAVKAAKLTISGVVPVVGGILSDASEAVILSAGVMKNAVGIYGLLVILAIWIAPFLQLGIQFLLLKLTAALSGVFDVKQASNLIEDFSSAMGLLLAMTGTVSLLMFISTVCFMKGMG
ncbi:MAG: stage III sporulation protein AE [Ruminococcaceae bacterium]|nr:stage III sporulation protein AE [Oscillospiraceae bacterium]